MGCQNEIQRWNWRRDSGILLSILALYLALAFYGIGHQSLWEDEYLSVRRVASPIPIWKDGHGFLYFALLKLWTQLGTSERILRSLSVLLGASAIGVVYAVGCRLCDRRVGAIAAALMATSPFFIWFSQETRYITLTILSALLAQFAFHQALICGTRRWWFAYAAAVLLALFSFVATFMLPLSHGIYLLCFSSRRPLLKKWLGCQAIVFLVFAWWVVNGTHYFHSFVEARRTGHDAAFDRNKVPITADFNQVRIEVIPYSLFAFSTGFSLGPSPRELHRDRSLTPLVAHIPALLIVALLYGTLLLSGVRAFPRRREAKLFILLWLVVPILGIFGIARLLNLFYDTRYVAMAVPAYFLWLAAGIAGFRRVGVQIVLFGAVLVVHGTALANYYFDPRYAREDTRGAAQYLEAAAGPQDLFLVVGTVSSLPHYYKGNLPLIDFKSIQSVGQPLKEELRNLTGNLNRIWLVQIRPWQVDRAGVVKRELDNTCNLVESRHFPGVDVYTYQVPPT
jgi:uncharacterized membrane protein